MYRVIIIEDEKIAADNLSRMIKELDSSFEVLACIESVRAAKKALTSYDFDLVFMDIHLTDGNAFELLEDITLHKPIIFTTAYDQYMLRAFKYLSIDYLLKPIDKKELKESILKFQRHFSPQNEAIFDIGKLQKLLKKEDSYKERFLVQIGKKLMPILIKEISHFISSDKTTYLSTNNGKRYPIDPSLSQLENELDPNHFFRINRQYLISRESIQHIYMVSPTKMKVILASDPDLNLFASIDRMSKFKHWMKS